MEKKYFIAKDNQKLGPFTITEVAEAGISVQTLVWYEGLPNWTEARYLVELQGLFQNNVAHQPVNYHSNATEERIGNVLYHADKTRVTLFIPEGEIYYEYAGFGDRLAAFLLDRLICFFLLIFPFIGAWLYYALLHSSDGQATVGQRAMNIKCLSDEGNRIDFGQATGRFFMSIVSGFILGIGYFLFFGSDKKQTLHDSVAKTIVVKEIGRRKYNF